MLDAITLFYVIREEVKEIMESKDVRFICDGDNDSDNEDYDEGYDSNESDEYDEDESSYNS